MLGVVTGAVDYLGVSQVGLHHTEIGEGAQGARPDRWVRCSDLISDREVLAGALATTSFGAPDDAVRASLFCQGYAFRVASVVLAPYVLGLAMPDVHPANVVVGVGSFGVGEVGVRSAAIEHRRVDVVATELLAGHLGAVIEAVRAQTDIGARLLWGNVASACARVMRAVEGAVPQAGADRQAVRRRAEEFIAVAGELVGVGEFVVGPNEWRWQRNVCCLWFRCQGGDCCDDCNMPGRSTGRSTV